MRIVSGIIPRKSMQVIGPSLFTFAGHTDFARFHWCTHSTAEF